MPSSRSARSLLAVASLTMAAGLAGCAPGVPSTPGGSPSSPITATSEATPTASYPFTPAATPTIMPAGATARPSKGGPTLAPTAGGPLNGKIVYVDPGHSGGYGPDVYNSRPDSAWGPFMCASTGTQTDDDVKPTLTEHQLNWQLAVKTSDALRARGATVVLSRPSDSTVGPCNAERAELANAAKADLLLSLHADGQRPNSVASDPTGFHVQTETAMVGGPELYQRSLALAENIVRRMSTTGQQPITNYVLREHPQAIWQREKSLTVLGGLKKTPGALIEVGNMKNKKDLARISNPATQDLEANALVAAVEDTLLEPAYATPTPENTPGAPQPTSAAPTISPAGLPSATLAPSPTASR